MEKELLSRTELAQRWGVTPRTLDRRRCQGLLPWIDLAAGQGARPQIRFRLKDVLAIEARTLAGPEVMGRSCGMSPISSVG